MDNIFDVYGSVDSLHGHSELRSHQGSFERASHFFEA